MQSSTQGAKTRSTPPSLVAVLEKVLPKEQRALARSMAKTLSCAIQVACQERGGIRIPGVGALKVVERAERMAHNPKTGDKVLVPAKTVLRFRAEKKSFANDKA